MVCRRISFRATVGPPLPAPFTGGRPPLPDACCGAMETTPISSTTPGARERGIRQACQTVSVSKASKTIFQGPANQGSLTPPTRQPGRVGGGGCSHALARRPRADDRGRTASFAGRLLFYGKEPMAEERNSSLRHRIHHGPEMASGTTSQLRRGPPGARDKKQGRNQKEVCVLHKRGRRPALPCRRSSRRRFGQRGSTNAGNFPRCFCCSWTTISRPPRTDFAHDEWSGSTSPSGGEQKGADAGRPGMSFKNASEATRLVRGRPRIRKCCTTSFWALGRHARHETRSALPYTAGTADADGLREKAIAMLCCANGGRGAPTKKNVVRAPSTRSPEATAGAVRGLGARHIMLPRPGSIISTTVIGGLACREGHDGRRGPKTLRARTPEKTIFI